MKKIFFYTILLLAGFGSYAQDFITRGTIEYEVKLNSKRMYGEKSKQMNAYFGGESMPEFLTLKKKLYFNNNKCLYTEEQKGSYSFEPVTVYTDLDKKQSIFKSSGFMEESYFSDSIIHVRWKIENETRVIAGFKCRKAVGVIMDSVYVVAFYAPEIVPQGGPQMFTGLPGMILGMAIPRAYTTWFATKVQLELDDKVLEEPVSSKKIKIKSFAEVKNEYLEQMKAFSSYIKTPGGENVDFVLKGLNIPTNLQY